MGEPQQAVDRSDSVSLETLNARLKEIVEGQIRREVMRLQGTAWEVQRTIEHYEQALAISREIRAASTEHSAEWTEARRGEGNHLGNLGLAYAALAEGVERAIEYVETALRIFEEIKSPYAELARARLAEWRAN